MAPLIHLHLQTGVEGMNTEREMLKLESLNREEEAESLKLEEKVYLDFRDLKSEELNLKWILGRRDIEKKNLLIFFFGGRENNNT